MPLIIIASQDWNALVASVAALSSKLDHVLANQTQGAKAMSAISDAVATLKTKLDAEGVAIQNLLTFLQTINQQLKDALANAADDTAAVAAITDLSAEVDTQVQQIQSANPLPTP